MLAGNDRHRQVGDANSRAAKTFIDGQVEGTMKPSDHRGRARSQVMPAVQGKLEGNIQGWIGST
jgi:hypothetical protein